MKAQGGDSFHIRALRAEDLPQVKVFADRAIGHDYYSASELEEIFRRSWSGSMMTSLVLEDDYGEILGIRITYPPGCWARGKGKGLSPELWQIPFEEIAYFQSLFIDPRIQGKGWGHRMSVRAIDILKKSGARAIVCHSWKESPHDSSGRYLRSLGFQVVATHPHYWKEIDYVCTRCGKPCLCTAEEMILRL